MVAGSACLAACATTRPVAAGRWGVNGTMKPYAVGGVRYVPRDQPGYDKVGLASWYAEQGPHRRTADGEVFDASTASGAHTTLPLPCWVEVTNLDNGRRIRLRVNDRGPFAHGRILDVSRRAAQDLGFLDKGMARVRVRYVGPAGATQPLLAPPAVLAAASPPPPEIVEAAAHASAAHIQAGAFGTRAAAERAAASLSGEGAASIEPVEHNGATLYRVVIVCPGGADPGAVRDRIAAAGFDGARVTPGS